ncbi:hypothetical protein [Thermus sp.]|uniref:hypothetical protein n=1 Tax=Thermus sp. TaxID=275 RepID=UPI0026260347|nr:hypothetical protein [Thermus sp.]MCX7850828.1 hypothetical protein [Thermus sp.]
MAQLLVLAVNIYQRKDGGHAARVVVASTPRNPNTRGLVPVEFDALPEVADTMKVLPGVYKLDLDFPVANGFGGRANEVRPLVVGAQFVAAMVPEKKADAKPS